MGKKIAGGNCVSGEGPYIEYMKAPDSDKGYYYLFVSYGFFNSNGGYNMRIFRRENPDGPYVDQNGNSAVYPFGGDNIGGSTGERLMSNYQWDCDPKPFKAQGHNSALMDDDGEGRYSLLDKNGNALSVADDTSEDGANIILSPWNGSQSQKFTLMKNNDGTYSFLSVVSRGIRCIDVYNISKEDGANICQWEFWGGEG